MHKTIAYTWAAYRDGVEIGSGVRHIDAADFEAMHGTLDINLMIWRWNTLQVPNPISGITWKYSLFAKS